MKFLWIVVISIAFSFQCFAQDAGDVVYAEEGGLGQSANDEFDQYESEAGARTSNSGTKNNARNTMLLGLGMGAGFSVICSQPWGGGWACPMAAMSFLDAAKSAFGGGNSQRLEAALAPGFDFNNPNLGNNPYGAFNNPDDLEFSAGEREAIAGIQSLQAAGYTVNPDTGAVTGPDGKTSLPGDYASQAALEAKGYSREEAKNILSKLASIQDEAESGAGAKAIALGGEKALAGGPGEYKSGGGGGDAGGDIALIEFEKLEGLKKRDKKKAAGRLAASEAAKLSRNFKGTPIGISVANIFVIVQKKYQSEDKKRAFIHKEF